MYNKRPNCNRRHLSLKLLLFHQNFMNKIKTLSSKFSNLFPHKMFLFAATLKLSKESEFSDVLQLPKFFVNTFNFTNGSDVILLLNFVFVI